MEMWLVGVAVLLWLGVYCCKSDVEVLNVLGLISLLIGIVAVVISMVSGYSYIASEYKMNIINREYNTSYTQLEVFYASDVIETVRELNRQRIEVNGNLITGETK